MRRLDRVIDRALLRKNNSLGNCVGLTNLVAVLGLRENLNLSCLVFPDHVALTLKNKRKQINLDLASTEDEFDTKYFKKEKNEIDKKRIEVLLPVLIQEKGNFKMILGKNKVSEKYYQKALELERDKDLGFLLGNINLNLKNFQKTLEYNKRELKNGNKDKDLYLTNMFALDRLERYNESLKNANIHAHLNPNEPISYFNRGDLHFRLGNYEKALNDYQKVLTVINKNKNKKMNHKIDEEMGEENSEEFPENDLQIVKRRIRKLNQKLKSKN